MANEEEMESFEISEQDLYVAFHPGQRRGYRRTKNQQIYGVFNEESDDEGPSSSDRYKKKFKTEDFTIPVVFVKSGVHQVGGTKKSKSQKARYLTGTGQSSKQSSHTGLGDWEKHTTGIGSKLLMQMGYEPGKGLGKSLPGRCAPVEATVRKGRGAIGAYGAEHKAEPAKFVDLEDEEEKEFQKEISQWRQDGGETKSRKKDRITCTFRTTEYSEISKTKVTDMTGRETRVLSGYSALAARKTTEPDRLQ
jgi:tuftelin-interacting protein 11